MVALDLPGRRWTLRIIWELRDGPVGPRPLLARCEGLSSSVLYQRLTELTEAAVIASAADGYTLGTRLHAALAPLDAWSTEWAESQLDTD